MRLIALTLALVLASLGVGCGSQASNQTTTVPVIVGLKLRVAEGWLFARHLRWRIAPGTHVFSQLEPADVSNSMDDIPVKAQIPIAGTAAQRNAVVTIITPCTRRHPCA